MGFKLEQTLNPKVKSSSKKDKLEILLQKEITLFGHVFNNKKKEDFYSELAVLLNAGVQLREALQLLADSQKKEKMKGFYDKLLEDLDSGRSFSEILQSQKEFTEYEYYSVQIGEKSGNLPKIVHELGRFFLGKNEQRRNIINALTYPIIILCTAILVVLFMLRMVVPMFEDIFRQNGVELPAITKAIITASNMLQEYGLLLFVVLAGVILGKKYVLRTNIMKRYKDHFLLGIPFLGSFTKSVYLAQFTQAIALLTSSKVPVLNSVQMVRRMISFYPLQDALTEMESKIMLGFSLHESIKDNAIFDNKMASLIRVAEETNQTEYIFKKLNQQYALEVQQKSKLLTTLLEPLIIVVVGFFVGIILVSMYLPMFKLSSVLG